MTPTSLGDALARDRSRGHPSLVVYLMVDALRGPTMGPLARACRRAGASAIELGFPFSDPIADGPVLQDAASLSLRHGTRWSDLRAALRAVSAELPVAVMTYANPVLHHGLDPALEDVAAAGGSGLIVPDLSLEESGPWERAAQRAGVALVQMASPATPTPRVRALARRSSGFLYLVSRYGTTGAGRAANVPILRSLTTAAHEERPDLPVLLGFGVRRASDLRAVAATGTDGVVVGSVVEERLRRSGTPAALERFLRPWTA